jgi:hypothetical protein
MGRRAVTELLLRLRTGQIAQRIFAVEFAIVDRDSA